MLKEIFASLILAKFYPDGSWLNELTDMDHMVEYNTINLSHVGADPAVVTNNSTWPLVPVQRTDNGVEIPLSTFDTKPTFITKVEEMETSYKKCESVLNQHIESLRKQACLSAAYNMAPANAATGRVLIGSTSLEFMALLMKAKVEMDKANLPQEGRILLLNPDHEAVLVTADMDLSRSLVQNGHIFGFKIYNANCMPMYNAEGTKQAMGTLTGQPSSLVFHKDLVMRAMGDVDARVEERWADYRGWLIGAQMRFAALPMKEGEGVYAITTPAFSIP